MKREAVSGQHLKSSSTDTSWMWILILFFLWTPLKPNI